MTRPGLTRSVFSPDTLTTLEPLASVGRTAEFRPGQQLFGEGEESDHIALISFGVVKITALTGSGREALLGLRGPGEIVGELAALDGSRRSATVRALDHVAAIFVPASTFRQFLQDHPEALFAMLAAVIRRLREADRRRLEFAGFDVPERVALLLAELVGTHGEPNADGTVTIKLPLSQDDIANATGASREAVAKALRTLREAGTIMTARRKIVVRRIDVLRSSHS